MGLFDGKEIERLNKELENSVAEAKDKTAKLNAVTNENNDLRDHVKLLLDQSKDIERISANFSGIRLDVYPYELGAFIKLKTECLEKINYNRSNNDNSVSEKENKALASKFVFDVRSLVLTNTRTLNNLDPMIKDILKEIQNYSSLLGVTSSKRHDLIEKFAQILVNENPKVSTELRNIVLLNNQTHTRINSSLEIIQKNLSKTRFFSNKQLNQIQDTFNYMRKEVQAEANNLVQGLERAGDKAITGNVDMAYFARLASLASDVLILYNGLSKDTEKLLNEVNTTRDLELDIIKRIKSDKNTSKKVELMKVDLHKELVEYYKALRKLATECESAREFFNKYIPADWPKMKPFQDFSSNDHNKEFHDYAEHFFREKDSSYDKNKLYAATTPIIKILADFNAAQHKRYLIRDSSIYQNKTMFASTTNSLELQGLQTMLLVERNFDANSKYVSADPENIEQLRRDRPAMALILLLKIGCRFAENDRNQFSIFDIPENVDEYVKAVIGV